MLVPNDQLRDLDERAKGGDVVPFRRGSLLFTHPNAVREILITHDAAFQKSPALRKASWTLGNGLLTGGKKLSVGPIGVAGGNVIAGVFTRALVPIALHFFKLLGPG